MQVSIRALARFVLFVLTAWLAVPVFFASQLEAYTANISSLALNFGPDAPVRSFPDYGLIGEYIYVTRIGIVLLIRAIGEMTGTYGAEAFRALMVVSLAGIIAVTVAIVRRFGPGGGLTAWLALLLVPGAFDTAFFFNDNLLSAALALGGVALVAWRNGLWASALAGMMLAYAILCRTDAVMVAPILAGVGWLSVGTLRGFLLRVGLAIVGALLVWGVVLALTGITVFQALELGALFAAQTPPVVGYLQPLLLMSLLGIPGGVLFVMGLSPSWASNGWVHRLTFIIYPILVVVFFAWQSSTQVRHFYPLLIPVFALHIASGITWLSEVWQRGGGWRIGAGALIAVFLAISIVPPSVTQVWRGSFRLADGPRSLYVGRLWMTPLWLRWQTAQRASSEGASDLVAVLDGIPLTTILVSHYDDIGYLTLALFEQGYETRPAAAAIPECGASGVVVFERDGDRIAIVRNDNQYGMMPFQTDLMAAVLADMALGCDALWDSDRFILTAMGRPDRREKDDPLGGIYAGLADRADEFAVAHHDVSPRLDLLLSDPFEPSILTRPFVPSVTYQVDVFHAIELSREELADIAARAAARAVPEFTYADIRAIYAPRFGPTEMVD